MRPFSGLRTCGHRGRGANQFARGGQSMNRRKTDPLWILVLIFGLGVVTTGYAQSFLERKVDASYQASAVQDQSVR